MKKDGSYRFNLKFSCDGEKNIKAGELLERYGNRKSMLVIEALNEYMDNHQELKQNNCEIHIVKEKNNNSLPDNWIDIVKEMIAAENNSTNKMSDIDDKNKKEVNKDALIFEDGISEMLSNIESFIV